MYKNIGIKFFIVAVLFLGFNQALADSFTFPDWQTVQSSANAPSWFAAAGSALSAFSNANDFFAAVVVAVNADPAHIAAGATASRTSDWIVCLNGVTLSLVPPPPPPSPPPPPPPPPSCSYIASYTDSWSNCNISSNWTTAWTITCAQTNSPSSNYATLGSYTCPGDAPYPSTTATKTISLNLSSPSNTCNIFADNIDSCTVTANISGSTNDNKPISWLSWKDIKNVSNLSLEKSNRIDNVAFNSITNNALNFNSVSSSAITGNWTSFNFTISGIKARSPFVSSSWRIWFEIMWLNWYTTMSLNNIFYNFKKPYRANLVTVDWTNLKIWTQDNVKINIAKWKTSYSFATNTTNIKETLVADSSNFNIQNKKDPFSTNTLSPTIKFQLNYIWSGPISWAWIKMNPNISYSIDWNTAKYVLTDDFVWNNTNELVLWWAKITWVKIIWLSQAYWKQSITNTANVNFSNIWAIDLKTAIKKNVAVFDKVAKEWVNIYTSNWHKYYYKKVNSTNVNLSSLNLSSDIETLVIRNGNLVIDQDINNKLWIIVTKDDLSNDNIWNVFVKQDVKLIKSFIYADGWFISLDSTNTWVSGYQDSYERSINLSSQLVMIWSLFSKNTIGWAILWSTWKYSLPGWQTTILNDKAIMYDLNYIRRWNAWWNSSPLNTLNKWNTDPFIIIYDSTFQSNPPVGFR